MGLFKKQPVPQGVPADPAVLEHERELECMRNEREDKLIANQRADQQQRRQEDLAEQQRKREARRAFLKALASRAGAVFPRRQDTAKTLSHLEQVRQEVEKFDEDRRHPLERLLIFVFTVASYVLPVVIALYIGWEIGDAYGGIWRAGDSFSQGMHVTAFAGEIAQAMFVIAISFAARAWARNRENLWLLVTACVFFALFILASGLAQWYVSTLHISPKTNAGQAGLFFRISMPALFDIGAAIFLAIVNVKHLKRFLQQQEQKAEAIEKVNKSILRIEEAQEEAKQRKEQHTQYLESMKATQGLVIDLQRIITGRILAEASGGSRVSIAAVPQSVPQLPDNLAGQPSEGSGRQTITGQFQEYSPSTNGLSSDGRRPF